MILTCPSCSTRYFADDASLGGKARRVRCASCGHTWRPPRRPRIVPEADLGPEALATAGAAAFAPAAARPLRPLAPGALDTRAALLKWGCIAVAALALVAGVIAYRVDVVGRWPWTAAAYRAAGFAAPADGLALEDITAAPGYEKGAPTLTVSAVVRNVTGRARPVLPVRIALLDAKRKELFAWTVTLDVSELPARRAVRFATKVVRPPVDAEDVEVRLAPAGAWEATPVTTVAVE